MWGFNGSHPPLTANAALRWHALSQLLPARLGDVLEIGCGQGSVTSRLAQRADTLLAVEPDEQSYEVARQRLAGIAEVRNVDSEDLPSEMQFDTVCAFEVLEHIEDDQAALEQWVARIRPAGRLVLSVPAYSHRMGVADKLVGHYRRYDAEDLVRKVKAAGLGNVQVRHYGGPGGYALEGAREIIAKHKAASAGRHDIASRTAASGRFLQPQSGWQANLVNMASIPLIALQNAFPDRGPGLVALAERA